MTPLLLPRKAWSTSLKRIAQNHCRISHPLLAPSNRPPHTHPPHHAPPRPPIQITAATTSPGQHPRQLPVPRLLGRPHRAPRPRRPRRGWPRAGLDPVPPPPRRRRAGAGRRAEGRGAEGRGRTHRRGAPISSRTRTRRRGVRAAAHLPRHSVGARAHARTHASVGP